MSAGPIWTRPQAISQPCGNCSARLGYRNLTGTTRSGRGRGAPGGRRTAGGRAPRQEKYIHKHQKRSQTYPHPCGTRHVRRARKGGAGARLHSGQAAPAHCGRARPPHRVADQGLGQGPPRPPARVDIKAHQHLATAVQGEHRG